MNIAQPLRRLVLPVIGIMLSTAPLFGEVYFYEGFDYETGTTLHGKSGADGFASGSSWTMKTGTEAHATVTDTVLSYNLGGTLLVANQSVNITGIDSTVKDFAYYKLDTTHNVNEFYVSFLVSSSEWAPFGGQFGLAMANSTTAANYQTVTATSHATTGEARWQTNVGAGSQAVSYTGNTLDETHLIVVRFYKEGDGITYFNKSSLWIDPTSAVQGAPDAAANVGGGRISAFLYLNLMNFSSGDADFNIGRIVGGSSWNDVVAPIPEPGTVSLAVGGAAAALLSLRARRRRRKGESAGFSNHA